MTRNLLHRPARERLDTLLDLRWWLAPAAVIVLALAAVLVVPDAPPTTTVAAAATSASEPDPSTSPEPLYDNLVQPYAP